MGPINIMGTVEEITIRYCVIRTFDKRRTIIPNSTIAKTPIKTLKTEPLVKGEFTFKIPRSAIVSQVKQIVFPIINSNKYILYPEYTSLFISGFDNIGVIMKACFFTNPAKKTPALIARDLKRKIVTELKKYGISTKYQHLTITKE
jgi:small-conductance mechanosensitive channel